MCVTLHAYPILPPLLPTLLSSDLHIYRQQRFWGDLADKQPEAEQHACLLQFLGLAERIYTNDYGQLIELRMKVERLRSRRSEEHTSELKSHLNLVFRLLLVIIKL